MSTINLLKQSLNAASFRQEAISSNLTNANTPGYKASQVQFESLLGDALEGTALRKTHPNHFGVGPDMNVEPVLQKQTNTSVKENGNNVDVDMEMVNLAQNQLHYQALISQLNAQYRRVNTVINT
ncbi:flagellar basal body rod protein FlgB [Jeotgalibaca caeni]|uniref:flagellar basal body rod protein FlgB n=1 Tax=Jeotgalibaca caeni TaxID=3028623 RepID=UPI00237EB316|nr:flagellar basal body rod protein FlgB [Jeotgalibaca caeni]MDE1548288.1 flagellar basal body rod protein FlgB [Jeotgalibaca caeni]